MIFMIFPAGFETSSTAMTYSLFELSQNQAVQDKARDSVKRVLKKYEGIFTYEAMMEMTYIENCISGTRAIIREITFHDDLNSFHV